jgi:hypothetical protein
VTTKAWLEGHQFDLEDLAQLLATGDVRVVRDPDAADDNAYYLTAPEIDNPPEGTTFYDVAQRLLSHINGIGRVNKADFRPVQLTGRYGTPTGQSAVVAAASGELRLKAHVAGFVTGPDGQPKPDPPSPWPNRFALAARNADVAEVLEIMGSPEPPEWADLFKVHEKIQDSIQGSIPKMGWASQADEDAFGASANRRDVSGRDARHARREKRPPPKRTMTVAQGREYIGDIVAKWLDYLR